MHLIIRKTCFNLKSVHDHRPCYLAYIHQGRLQSAGNLHAVMLRKCRTPTSLGTASVPPVNPEVPPQTPRRPRPRSVLGGAEGSTQHGWGDVTRTQTTGPQRAAGRSGNGPAGHGESRDRSRRGGRAGSRAAGDAANSGGVWGAACIKKEPGFHSQSWKRAWQRKGALAPLPLARSQEQGPSTYSTRGGRRAV